MLFSQTNKRDKSFEFLGLDIDNYCLPCVECTKFLGIYIDHKLNWNDQFNHVTSKMKRNCHMLKTGQNVLSVHAKIVSHIQSPK